MTMILIFLGWFILSSLWGFLPVIEPLRLFALSNPRHRKMIVFASGLLALLIGIFILLWVGSYSIVVIMAYDAHTASELTQARSTVNVFSVTNELALRQLLPGIDCLNKDVTVCSMAAQALQLGSLGSMLPIISAAALIPTLSAAFICWKLTTTVQTDNPS